MWVCGFEKYLQAAGKGRAVVVVDTNAGWNGQYRYATGSIELNRWRGRGDFMLASALTLMHEATHYLDYHRPPANRTADDRLDSEGLAYALELIGFAEYLAASGKLDHLDDPMFYSSIPGLSEIYDNFIDTPAGAAFAHYLIEHPLARSSNDPEVFARAYAATRTSVARSPVYMGQYTK
jgi:hypothetical protein